MKPVEVGDHVPVPLNILEHWQHKIMVGFGSGKQGGTRLFGHVPQKISKKLLVPTVSPHG